MIAVFLVSELEEHAQVKEIQHKLAMVSIRRRKLLGLSPGANTYLVQVVRLNENGEVAEHSNENPKPHSATMQSMFSFDFSRQKQVLEPSLGSSNVSGCSSSKEHKLQCSGHEMKRRKRQRRKQFDNQEPCLMRGVYFKNMKWQAAIKVEKKQIHLGTVGSQEEAAHLYDRAAFMCGREPNFELSEEEKQELRKFNWEEFLELTRNAITNKKHQKKLEAGMRKKQLSQAHVNEHTVKAQTHNVQATDAGVSNF